MYDRRMAADDQINPEVPHLDAAKTDGPTLRYLIENGYLSPDWVLVQITGANTGASPGWWGLDEVAKLAARTPEHFEPHKYPGMDWWLVPSGQIKYLESVFLDLGLQDRLKVRKLPTA